MEIRKSVAHAAFAIFLFWAAAFINEEKKASFLLLTSSMNEEEMHKLALSEHDNHMYMHSTMNSDTIYHHQDYFSQNLDIDSPTAKNGAANTSHWQKGQGHRIARTFKAWDTQSPNSWCIHKAQANWSLSRQYSGLLFAKMVKTGSSTMAGIAMRIARSVGRRHLNPPMECQNFVEHEFSYSRLQRFRDKHSSFLFTVVRRPESRALSNYYFHILGHENRSLSPSQLVQYLEANKNHQTVQLRDYYEQEHDPFSNSSPVERLKLYNAAFLNGLLPQFQSTKEQIMFLKRYIIDQYDFIAVMERIEESLVVLKLLLGLKHSDIIGFSAKSSGGWSINWGPNGEEKPCFLIPKRPNVLPAEVQKYLDGGEFERENLDFLLYEAGNRSLDLTIESLGKPLVYKELKEHHRLSRLVSEACKDENFFPCSQSGHHQHQSETNCYAYDLGCGHLCIDRFFSEMEETQ